MLLFQGLHSKPFWIQWSHVTASQVFLYQQAFTIRVAIELNDRLVMLVLTARERHCVSAGPSVMALTMQKTPYPGCLSG